MATTSTVSEVRQAIVDRLSARTALTDVQIAWSWPGRATSNETIFCAPPIDGDSGIPVMRAGRQKRDESYRVDVVCQVVRPGGEVREAFDRAFELMGELEDELADDPLLGLTSILWAQVGGYDLVEGLTDQGGACRLEVHVDVRARLD